MNLEIITCIKATTTTCPLMTLMKKQRTTKTFLQPKCSLRLRLVIVVDLLDNKSLT